MVTAVEPTRLHCAIESDPDRVAAGERLSRARDGATLTSLRTRASLEERYLDLIGESARGDAMRAWWAQTRAEVRMTIRRGETLLLTLGIPILLLVFFSLTHVTTTPAGGRINFIAPGILALCVLSTSLVALSIATGFERSYGVLRRLHVTPLGQRRMIAAKIAGGRRHRGHPGRRLEPRGAQPALETPRGRSAASSKSAAALLLGSAGCAGIGLLLAGRLRAEVNLAADQRALPGPASRCRASSCP